MPDHRLSKVVQSTPHFTRRDMLRVAAQGSMGGIALAALGSAAEPAAATGCMRIRPNLHSLDPDGPELTAYAQGIQAMKLLGETDPLSWLYQADIHGTFTTPAQPLWNTCEHGTRQFWPWHRLYLVMFERIVRQASGYQAFTLPFWDYADPDQRVLPAPFRDSGSPLFVGARNPDVNAGTQPSSGLDSIFDHCPGFGETDFGFASSLLEGTPHGQVHVWVEGWMGAFETAGQDPIFWLHHANIDRLWESWLAQGGGRVNPVDAPWLTFPLSFIDETGDTVIMTTADVLEPAELCYGYAYLATCKTPPIAPPIALAPPETPTVIGEPATDGAIALGPEALTLPIELSGTDSIGEDSRIVLNLEGVSGTGILLVTYEVYVNLPEGLSPNYRSIYYVGNLNLFGLQPNGLDGGHNKAAANQRFSLSRNIAALRASDEWTGELTITFVPLELGTPTTNEEGTVEASSVREGPWATIDRIAITSE